MTYDPKYYSDKKQVIQQKFQKAQQKWLQMCEMSGREYLDFQTTAQECQEQLKQIEQEELKSKTESLKLKK